MTVARWRFGARWGNEWRTTRLCKTPLGFGGLRGEPPTQGARSTATLGFGVQRLWRLPNDESTNRNVFPHPERVLFHSPGSRYSAHPGSVNRRGRNGPKN